MGKINILDHFSGMNFLVGFAIPNVYCHFVSAFRDGISLQMTVSFLYFQKHNLEYKIVFPQNVTVYFQERVKYFNPSISIHLHFLCPRSVSGVVSFVISPQLDVSHTGSSRGSFRCG